MVLRPFRPRSLETFSYKLCLVFHPSTNQLEQCQKRQLFQCKCSSYHRVFNCSQTKLHPLVSLIRGQIFIARVVNVGIANAISSSHEEKINM